MCPQSGNGSVPLSRSSILQGRSAYATVAMISSEMQNLARHLLAYETTAEATSDSVGSPTSRVYEKLRLRLSVLAGLASFQAFATRALILARSEAPGLSAVQIAADGSLQGLDEFDPQIGADGNQGGEEGVILVARLLGLLLIFLGEALTLSLVRDVWPDVAFNERSLENGRKA